MAGTNAPIKLLKTADPEAIMQKTADLDWIMVGRSWRRRWTSTPVCFMHSDAGMAYGALSAPYPKPHYAVFGKNAEALGESRDYPTEKIVAKATHNPGPLKSKIDKVII